MAGVEPHWLKAHTTTSNYQDYSYYSQHHRATTCASGRRGQHCWRELPQVKKVEGAFGVPILRMDTIFISVSVPPLIAAIFCSLVIPIAQVVRKYLGAVVPG